MSTERLGRLREEMTKQGFAAMIFNAGPTLTYMTGMDFHLMERPVVVALPREGEPVIVLPELEAAKLASSALPLTPFCYGEDPVLWGRSFQQALGGLCPEGGKIGVEPRQLRLLEYDYLLGAQEGGEIVDGSALVAALRAVKDQTEITAMRRAVRIAEEALEATLPMVKVGSSEREIAAELQLQLLRHGSDSTLPFAPIVSSGANGANPHARPSAKRLVEGDLLIVDWGAAYEGYVSDITRTFAVGRIDAEAQVIHQVVLAANRAGREAGGPGRPCAAVDRAARNAIEEAGYGRFFTHRTGHGIGMECHEEPYIRSDNRQLLQAGMTYTVEPGIYLAGRNGVRIEDDVLVTPDGAESLSTMVRELRVVG